MSSLGPYAQTLKSLVGLQLITRLTSFSLNQALVRIASPVVYGTAAIQFDLVRDTVLFLGREAVRGVVLRAQNRPQATEVSLKRESSRPSSSVVLEEQTLNLSILPPVLGLTVIVTLVPLYVATLPNATTTQSNYRLALLGYILATLIELAVEPFVLGTQIGIFRLTGIDAATARARAEGAGVIARAVATFLFLSLVQYLGGHDGYALLSFAAGQIVFSVVLYGMWVQLLGFSVLYRVATQASLLFRQNLRTKTPKQRSRRLFDEDQLHLLGALSAQSIFKHFLTEADRAVVSLTSPLEDQAGYALASNYASLIARIVFQPLEEAARLYFSRTVRPQRIASTAQDQAPFQVLANLLHLSIALPMITVAFVPAVSPVIRTVLLPGRYQNTSAAQTLVTYLMFYLPAMSLNGILEAFFAATTDTTKIAQQSGVMAGCSLVFGSTLLALNHVRRSYSQTVISAWLNPECSLVYANTLQMLCRIAFAGKHAVSLTAKNIGEHSGFRWGPGIITTLGATISGILLLFLPVDIALLPRLGAAGLLGIFCMGLIVYEEVPYWQGVYTVAEARKEQ